MKTTLHQNSMKMTKFMSFPAA
ncbi:hypothetical protein Ocin01_20245 [Orchesella cincta]|uniref:Uncharacterized protein n=1 Tax=Orchesella cincta TaxID=48709 RepID=A0A1D2M0C7_ORCCI|nr:hypothetical protein Ocin01_20245 [Orchesella cincta]